MKKEILNFENIYYSYDDEQYALDDISLQIFEKEKIAILGENGSGKSTFFLCCNGVLYPQKGELFLNGDKIADNRKDLVNLRQNVGIVFQDPNQQFIGTTVFDDVSFGVVNLGLDKATTEKRTADAINAMNLVDLKDRPPHYLSGGEKKRLSIADILAMEPKVVLFDEPTAFLDTYNIGLFEDTLTLLESQNKTILISTHDINFAYSWADRVIIFRNGKIVADGETPAILTNKNILSDSKLISPTMVTLTDILKKENMINESTANPKNIKELECLIKKTKKS